MIKLAPEQFADYHRAAAHEWIVTNGIGGYASGTVAGTLTRHYHGYLVAATQPPLGRTLMLTKIDEWVAFGEYSFPLFANAWASGVHEALNISYLSGFRLEGNIPVWTFEREGMKLEKRVWMAQGENTTYVRYDLLACPTPLRMTLKMMANYRSHHDATQSHGWKMGITKEPGGVRVDAYYGAVPFRVLLPDADCMVQNEWYLNYEAAIERYRGLDAVEDHLYVADFMPVLEEGQSITLVATTADSPEMDGDVALKARRSYEADLLTHAPTDAPDEVKQLVLAADQFIVKRPQPDDSEGRTVIAGYHWFADWGRDTMIALPGLTLHTGRREEAAKILRTYADFVEQGMLPNRFAQDKPEYNTVDATLWYFEAIRATVEATGDESLIKDLFPVLASIIEWHIKGTRYGIRVDSSNGLLHAGEPGVQLTWMDAKVDDWVVTPRVGKPVEVNALWYNALRIMEGFAKHADADPTPYKTRADQVEKSFAKFWAADYGYLYDVLDARGADNRPHDDASLRPNQIFAVSLPHSPLSAEQQKAVVDTVSEHLLTARGLRTLAAFDEAYKGTYGGDRRTRDGAYHQGTVWPWLVGPFVRAHLRVYEDKEAARDHVLPLLASIYDHAVGTLSEIYDGDPPHHPRGAVAQAWSVAEVLRAWVETA